MSKGKIAYQVEQHNEPVKVTRVKVDDKGIAIKKKNGLFDFEERVVNDGFMVYFPMGHSVFFADHDELVAAGFADPAPEIDEETGEPVTEEVIDMDSPKAKVLAASRRRARPDTNVTAR